jgi:hypothetical protein
MEYSNTGRIKALLRKLVAKVKFFLKNESSLKMETHLFIDEDMNPKKKIMFYSVLIVLKH